MKIEGTKQIVNGLQTSANPKGKLDINNNYDSGIRNINQDLISVDLADINKGLTILADKVIGKLDEIIKKDLPDGIRSLNPEEHTPDKTAAKIFSAVVGLFEIYKKQNEGKSEEELVESFVKTVKGGIQKGHDEAIEVLQSVGVLEFGGIKEGISDTMQKIDQKFEEWKKSKLKDEGEQIRTMED